MWKSKTEHGMRLSIGGTIPIDFKMGYTLVNRDAESAYQVVEKVKRIFSQVLKDDQAKVAEG